MARTSIIIIAAVLVIGGMLVALAHAEDEHEQLNRWDLRADFDREDNHGGPDAQLENESNLTLQESNVLPTNGTPYAANGTPAPITARGRSQAIGAVRNSTSRFNVPIVEDRGPPEPSILERFLRWLGIVH